MINNMVLVVKEEYIYFGNKPRSFVLKMKAAGSKKREKEKGNQSGA